MQKIVNYINGVLTEPISQQYLENVDPSTGKVYSLIADSDQRDVALATEAAHKVFPIWSAMPAEKRSQLMLKIADLIDQNHEALALAECIDNGKPLKLARAVDIPRASANFRFFATAILHSSTESHLSDNVAINYTTRTPIGVAGCISPWNLPLYLFTWKIAPALATGNTVVAKPSEITPMTAFLLSKICIEAGLPAGVLNIVHGLGTKAGQAIVEHPDIPLISFTGGTSTGRHIAASAGSLLKKLSLELGGKNPNIVFADCDYEKALSTTIQSSFSNQGQICLCGSRVFVESSIYEKFKSDLVKRTQELKVGDPLNEDSRVGAIVSKPHFDKILGYIELAKQEGGKILTGGKSVNPKGRCADGYFIEPTIIEGLAYNCRTNQEEIFGPVITIMPFSNTEELVKQANTSSYGLAATIWTQNLNTAHQVAHQLKTGIVWVNCWLLRDLRTPFGGMKNSGIGREGGWEALRFFTEAKNICIKL